MGRRLLYLPSNNKRLLRIGGSCIFIKFDIFAHNYLPERWNVDFVTLEVFNSWFVMSEKTHKTLTYVDYDHVAIIQFVPSFHFSLTSDSIHCFGSSSISYTLHVNISSPPLSPFDPNPIFPLLSPLLPWPS